MVDFKPIKSYKRLFVHRCDGKYSSKDIVRFHKYVHFDIKNRCWHWLGATRSKDSHYGIFHLRLAYNKYKSIVASRVSYELFTGKIMPDDIQACHTCDNPICVNPHHIFPGTISENAIDKFNKGRGVDNSGEKNGMVKLNWGIVNKIRYEFKRGCARRQLAKLFKISFSSVGFIINNKTWYDKDYIPPPSRKRGYNGKN